VQFLFITRLNCKPNKNLHRKLVSGDVGLDCLFGKEFYVDEPKFYGAEVCEPCVYVSKLGYKNYRRYWWKSGLRKEALTSGEFVVVGELAE